MKCLVTIPDCFPGVLTAELGTLLGTVHLALKFESDPVFRGLKRIPDIELKELVKKELE